MSAPVLARKQCTTCGETKPLSAARKNPDGHQYECKDCCRRRVNEWHARTRAEMGDEAYRSRMREYVRRHREGRPERDRLQRRAFNRASAILRENHRAEFDALYAREKYEAQYEAAS